MANVAKFKLTGVKEFEKNLLKLQEMTQSTRRGTAVIGKALTAGSSAIRKAMKSATATDSGKLKRSLKSNARKQRKRTKFAKITGFAYEANDPKKSYVGMLEEGLYSGDGDGNQHKGKISSAVESSKNMAIKATLDKLAAELKKEFAKLKT